MDRYGRKVGVMYCAVLSLVGGVCLCAAQNIAMFIVFRFFAGAGSWAFLALSTNSTVPLFSFFSRRFQPPLSFSLPTAEKLQLNSVRPSSPRLLR
jgi:MFS family permease